MSLAGQDWATLGTSAWFSLGGFVLALYLAPSLNMLALGDRMAQGLGVSVLRTRTFTLLAIALLCGAAVSIAGPIGFVRPVGTADCPASGISGSARSAPSFSLCRRTFVITGRYYCPDAFHAP